MPLIRLLAPGPERTSLPQQTIHAHVLFIVDGFPKALGGGERIVLRLAELLPQHGFKTSILTFTHHPESVFQLKDAPCPVYLLPLGKALGLRSLRAAWELRRFVRQKEIRIVQTFFESSDLWGGVVTRLLTPAKLVWSRRDMGILRGRKHAVAYRRLRSLPHAVSAVSQRVADHVIAIDGVKPERVRVVYNGLDLTTSAPPAPFSLSASPVITTVGNVRRVKGHDLLLKAAPDVLEQFPKALFTIGGEVLEPEYFAELEDLAASLGITERVQFLGKITDLSAHLQTADVFILPSRSEGFSNALIEAMAAGKPCIATDVGGNAEAVQNGVNGLIVPAEAVSSQAEAILKILNDPSLAQRLGANARLAVEEKFTTEAMLQSTTALFRSLLR